MTEPTGHESLSHFSTPSLGILVTNLGTPDEPTAKALRRYLAEFLWDPRVVDLPRSLWWLILHGIILRIRPARSAASYRKIWGDEGSPLLTISRGQVGKLRQRLENHFNEKVNVVLGMRYGNPSIASVLHELRDANCQRLLVLPLYPQYSCSTTASTFDAVAQVFRQWRSIPEVRLVNNYHDHHGYIDALANSVREAWQRGKPGEQLLFSFHGTPLRFREEGDPYYWQCHETARLVADNLGLEKGSWQVVFQSRFGKEEWLKPYTDETLTELASSGIKNVDIICPGFSADCLETLEEIVVENRQLFVDAGGEGLNYIPALNERDDHIETLAALVVKHTRDW
jgi:ferrochelatase